MCKMVADNSTGCLSTSAIDHLCFPYLTFRLKIKFLRLSLLQKKFKLLREMETYTKISF